MQHIPSTNLTYIYIYIFIIQPFFPTQPYITLGVSSFIQFHDMGKDKSSLLTRLKRAVKKVRFLLDYSTNRWHLASVLRRASSSKRISFNDRPGLRAAFDDGTIYSDESGGSSSRSGIQRTMSFPSDEDVDKRADMFIANFYRQLRLERQISLELQYCRGNSFKSISP